MNGITTPQPHESVNSNVNGALDTPELREVDLAENASTRSAGVEGSLGSDTDTSKTDNPATSGKDTIPRYSVRKSTFKPVSVTKNLLARTSSISTPTKTSGEQGTDVKES